MILHSEEDAVKQAIEAGGWLPQEYGTFVKRPIKAWMDGNRIVLQGKESGDGWSGGEESTDLAAWVHGNLYRALQDLSFWQALGKARGWGEGECGRCGIDYEAKRKEEAEFNSSECVGSYQSYPIPHKMILYWKECAGKWFETLMSGGDMKAFWESLS